MEKRLKVLLYSNKEKAIDKVVLDRHLDTLIEALKLANIDYTFSKDDNFDIVHLFNYDQYKHFKSLRLKANQKNAPVIIEAFNDYNDFKISDKEEGEKSSSSLIVFRPETLKAYNDSNRILVAYSKEKTFIENQRVSVDVNVLKPGVQDIKKNELSDYEKQAFRSFYNLEPDCKVIVSLGDYSNYESVDTIINLARIMPDYEFFFYGVRDNSKYLSKLQKDASKVLNIHLEYLGYEELFNSMVYNTDLLIVTSPLIIESLNILNFMKAKIPVISIEGKAIYELLEENKTALIYRDFKDLYDKVKNIETTNCVDEAYKYASKFDMESYSNEIKKIYESVLNTERQKRD